MSGKGSRPRPFSVSNEEYARRWDAIFQRDIKQEEEKKISHEEDGGPLIDDQLKQIRDLAKTK